MTAIRNTRTTERMSQGVIAAVNNNGRGVCGIAGGRSNSGGVRIMSCQIMGNSTTGGKGNPTVKAFEYAWTNGAIIAQNSWGYNLETADGTKITPEEFEREWKSNYGIMRDAIDTFVRGAGTRNPNSPLQGGLVIFAAGNEGDVYGDVPDLSGRLRSGDRRPGRWTGVSARPIIPTTDRGSTSRPREATAIPERRRGPLPTGGRSFIAMRRF